MLGGLEMAGGILFGLWIFWTIALLILYHKVFTVYYFSLGNGLMKEIVTAFFLGINVKIILNNCANIFMYNLTN